MPLRDHDLLCSPLVAYLSGGKRPAWEIEEELAAQFKVTAAERARVYPKSGCPIWRNDVAFALKRLIQEGKIGREGGKRAPDGGFRGIYFLKDGVQL
jgi:hypothetical protein